MPVEKHNYIYGKSETVISAPINISNIGEKVNMYILRNEGKRHGYNGGFMTENIDELARILRMDPTLASQLSLTPEEQVYIAKEDIMVALSLNNPCLEIGLLVMERFWTRRAYDLIKTNMDEETSEEFRTEINKRKLIRGSFNGDSRSDRLVWDRLSIAIDGF